MRRALCLCALLGCGDVVNKPPPAQDAAADGPMTGPLTVTVLDDNGGGVPDLAANVLVVDATGTVLFDGLVDATGKVTLASVLGPVDVTVRSVVDRAPNRFVTLKTIRGARPGEDLLFGRPQSAGPHSGAMTTRPFSFTQFSPSLPHVFFTPCSNRFIAANTTMTGSLDLWEGCAGAQMDLFAIAGTSQSPSQFIYLPNINSAGGTINVAPPWTAFGQLTASYANVPSGMEYFATIRNVMLRGVSVMNTGGNIPNPGTGGTLQHQVAYAPGVGEGAMFDISFGNQTNGERQQVTISTAATTATIAFDFATQNLPRLLTIPTLTVNGASWTETAGTSAADARMVVWNGTFQSTGLTTSVTWSVIDGERSDRMTLPTLPDSYAAYDPRKLPGFQAAPGTYVYYVDCDVLADYAAARPLGMTAFFHANTLRPKLGNAYRCRRTESPYND